jgi:hypothetical protein
LVQPLEFEPKGATLFEVSLDRRRLKDSTGLGVLMVGRAREGQTRLEIP